MPTTQMPNQVERQASVYCPICTHTVTAVVTTGRKGFKPALIVKPGQKCQRCHSSIDAGVIMWMQEAA